MARDVTTDIIDHLRSEVTAASIPVSFSTSDDIGYAQYDDTESDVYVTPVSEDPVVPGGGQTQYSGIDPGGAGPIQDVVTSVQIDCWGGDIDTPRNQAAGVHPHTVANDLGREVHRVLFESSEASSSPPVPSGYHWVNADPPRTADDSEASPTKYRRVVVAYAKHLETPP